MVIGFIGAGKVGCTLGKYFSVNGYDVAGYYSRDPGSAKFAAEFTGTKYFSSKEELLSVCDTIFITVPDGTIKEVYNELKRLDIAGKQLCHCSGAMTAAEAFEDIEEHGSAGCSVHPLFPVSSKTESYHEIGKAFFCLEGDENCVAEWQEIFSVLGNPTRIISGSTKSEYHAACAIFSNLVCALADESISLMERCGFTEKEALSALEPLVMSNIRRILSAGPVEALTGPVERGDIKTVQKHIACMKSDTERDMYKAVSRRLTEVAQKKHPGADYSGMLEVLLI